MTDLSKPTLNDVARAAGVSTATVSRCLNTPERVIERTREKVMQAVDELGYTPNFGGRALASRRTNTVGAIIPTMENAIFARGLQAFQETLSQSGVTMLVASTSYDFEREAEQIRTLVGRGADGLLLIGSARPPETYEFLRRRAIPYVIAWNLGDGDDHFIGFDNKQAAAELTRHVIALGHRKIAMIAGLTKMNDRAADRVAGVQAALREAGFDTDAFPIVETAYSLENGSRALAQLMQRTPRPTAIICGNDVLAIGAIAGAKSLRIRVPEDVSITGFDDIDISSYIDPALTTIHVPHRRMGTAAAHQLLRLIAGEPADAVIKINTEIVERASLAPPAS